MAFTEEAKQPGCAFVTARQFVRRDPKCHPQWTGRTLFIDGLDEIRAGAGDPRDPLDEIIARLDALGNPPFRLSCRVGSWFEPGDARELASSPGIGELSEFHGYKAIEAATGSSFYFATPYHSWERGTSENTNGLIRQYLPKRTSMAHITQHSCDRIAHTLNTRPRKRLRYRTPKECYVHI